jgi:hypothetical protein
MGATLVMEAAGLSLGFRTAEDFDEGPPDPEPQPGLVVRLLLRKVRPARAHLQKQATTLHVAPA